MFWPSGRRVRPGASYAMIKKGWTNETHSIKFANMESNSARASAQAEARAELDSMLANLIE